MHTLSLVPSRLIERHWPRLSEILAPALATGSKSADDVLLDLVAGHSQCWVVAGDAEGAIVTSVTHESDGLALWIFSAAGKVRGGPRQRLATMQALISDFEAKAHQRGCRSVRVDARPEWRRVLTDYAREGSEYRKAL